VAMVTMDHHFRITSFNKRAEKLTGYFSSEAIGRPCREILNSRRCGNDCPLRTVRNMGESISGLETELVNRLGEHISTRIGASPIFRGDNCVIGYLEVVEDISRQKRMEREKNNFISMIAHDMKSPLVGISGLINRLKKEKIFQSPEKLRVYLKVLGETGERLESMVLDFLEYCRLESGQIKLELGETDINNVLLQVIEIHRFAAEGKNIVLSFDDRPLRPIAADANRLHRVIIRIVEEEDADLLVINSKGRTNFQDYMYGATSEKIFGHCPVSILSLNLRTW
jgi:PAS domain S-box-containing protein